MMDVDASPAPSRLDRARVGDQNTMTFPPTAPSRPGDANRGQQDADETQGERGQTTGLYASTTDDAASISLHHATANSYLRDTASTGVANQHTQPVGHSPLLRNDLGDNSSSYDVRPPGKFSQQEQNIRPSHVSNSQATTISHATDRIFTPPFSEGGLSNGQGDGQDSSQESQLLQLSQLVAAQEKLPVPDSHMTAPSRKRMADGVVKQHAREQSSASPVIPGGHSRNTSTVSMASTAGSRIGELSAELKARLSYALVKVNHGWQSHSIDQVESLASQAASPASSNSTIHLGHSSSASPQLSSSSQGNNPSATATGISKLHHLANRAAEHASRESPQMRNLDSPASPSKPALTLAPPVSIQPSRQSTSNPRRNSNARHVPALSTGNHRASPSTAPHTPGQPASPYLAAPQRTPIGDPMLFSPYQTPHQAVREQDAMEALLFMSSPNNSANLKHNFPPISSHPTSLRSGSQRTVLPGSQPRKTLPSGRPSQQQSQSQGTPRRVDFERSPGILSNMDIDEPLGTPRYRPRRKTVGQGDEQPPRLKHLPLSAGLTALSTRRPRLADEDIERMLDQAAAADESSDSEGEIQIPRRDGVRLGST